MHAKDTYLKKFNSKHFAQLWKPVAFLLKPFMKPQHYPQKERKKIRKSTFTKVFTSIRSSKAGGIVLTVLAVAINNT